MVLKQNILVVLVFILTLVNTSCRQAKYVPSEKYLYKVKKKNIFRAAEKSTIHFKVETDSASEIVASHNQIVIEDLYEMLKPQPNRAFNLFVYNRIDTLKVQEQVERKKQKTLIKNNKRIDRQNEINLKRNNKAKAKGETHYFEKNIRMKKPGNGWRYWIQTSIGEPPVVMNKNKVSKSAEQLHLFLRKRGFYENEVTSTIIYNQKKQKAVPIYTITPGKPIIINSVKFDPTSTNAGLKHAYYSMLKKSDTLIFVGDLLDEDKLDLERERYSKFCRDNAYFNFSKSYI